MSKYCSLTLNELRKELKSRSAKTSGRKKDLIERLESYDRNANFGRKETQPVAEFNMTLPELCKYVDLNSDKCLASVDNDKVAHYLKNFDKAMESNAINLYREKYLCYLRLCSTDTHDFIRSACRAEMRKSVVYEVDVSVTKDGHINETQCECAAGMGPNAHCKHVCAVLYACIMFTMKKTLITEQTCTQKLQSFHRAPRYKGSPLKARDIVMEGCDEFTNVTFDPRPEEYREMEGYNDYFRNICLNFKGVSSMPIFQLFPPANNLAVAHDHDYLLETPEDNFLKVLNVTSIDKRERANVEMSTRGQSKSDRWHKERQKRIQSSHFGRICKATERTDFKNLAHSLMINKQIKSEAIIHGLKYEKEAIKRYEEECHVSVKDCGIYVCEKYPFLGASPDGVLNEKSICEVKCPYSAKNRPISDVTVPYLKVINDKFCLNKTHDYYYQIQGQLLCSERSTCDLIVYTITDIKFITIKKDVDFISEMVAKLQSITMNLLSWTRCFTNHCDTESLTVA